MAVVADRPEAQRPPSPARERARRDRRRLAALGLLSPLAAAIAAGLAIAAVAVAIALVASSGPAPPATGAATLVPADALLYVNVSTDPSRSAVGQALRRVRRLSGAPLLLAGIANRLDTILAGSSSGTVDFATDIRPWLGPEAAFAVLDTPGASAGTLVVLDVSNRAKARAFLSAHGASPSGAYRNVHLLQEASGTTFAFVGHYLLLGQAASVTGAIDVARGRGRSLASSATYANATAGEPADRVLDFYAPVAGVTRALAPSSGLLGALGTLLDQPALSAVTVAVSPDAGGFGVRVHSLLDPKLANVPSAKTPSFTPTLASALPAGSEMMLDVPSLSGAVPKLLAAAAKLGIAGRAAGVLSRLGGALIAEGVNLHRFFSIFGSQGVLAIVPGLGGSGPAPVLVGRTTRPTAAVKELADLEEPLTQAFTPPSSGGGLVPEVGTTTLGRATVSTLTLAPGFELDWAVSHGLVVVSTSPGAAAAVISHRASLSGERAYKNAVAGLPTQVSTLVFLDLGPLLRLGERTGLVGGNTLAALRPDLEQIRAIGLATTRGGSDTTTQLQLQIR